MKKWRPTFLVELESDSHGFVRVPLELYEAHPRYILHLRIIGRYNWIKAMSRQSAKLYLQSSELGPPPPPPGSGGRGTLAGRWRERGWESPNSDEGIYSYTIVFFIYTYFAD